MKDSRNAKGRNPKYQGKRTNKSRKSELDDQINERYSKDNDWRWYAQNEQLLKDTASFSYNYPLGSLVQRTATGKEPVDTTAIPGIMAVHVSPAFGGSDSRTSPINVAMRNIYSFVRHANSGHTNYDAPDLAIYLMAMDSCYSFLSYLRRIYGVAMTFSYTNRYYPTAIVNAMDVNFEDIHRNLADFRAYINSLAVKVGSMCVPASMAYFARHMWMYEGYYLDSNQDKAQTYLYVPDGFYQYTLDTDAAGMLKFKPLMPFGYHIRSRNISNAADTLLTYQQLHDYGDALLEPILQSEDMNIMSGDILKAFGKENLYMVQMIPENYTVLPTYNEEVLNQINNATLVGQYVPESSAVGTNIGQLNQSTDKGYLFNKVMTYVTSFGISKLDIEAVNWSAFTAKQLINFDHGDVTPADTMVASRLTHSMPKPIYKNVKTGARDNTGTTNTNSMSFTSSDGWNSIGSEVANYAVVYYFDKTGLMMSEGITTVVPAVVSVDLTGGGSDVSTMPVNQVQSDVFRINMLSMFNRHPRVAYQFVLTVHTTEQDTCAAGAFQSKTGDINYYTVVDNTDLAQMAQTALLSMLNVTQFGRQQ
nr:MAG TPA: capsid [Picobirnaviridae sp.]